MTHVSVALASYNGAQYIRPFLASLEAQDWPSVRLCVSDDGSTDATTAIISEEWREATVVRNSGKQGVVSNFSSAIALTKGGYVALADQDDIWVPDKLSRLMATMIQRETLDPAKPVLIFSDLTVVDSELNVLQSSFFNSTEKSMTAAKLPDFMLSNHIPGCSILFNDALCRLALPIPPNVKMHDWWLALVAATFGVIDYVDAPLVLYRQHGSNTLGAPTSAGLSSQWRNFVRNPLDRVRSYQQHAAETRNILLVFRERFASTMLPSELATFCDVLDRGPLTRLLALRGAHTGENRMRSFFQAALM